MLSCAPVCRGAESPSVKAFVARRALGFSARTGDGARATITEARSQHYSVYHRRDLRKRMSAARKRCLDVFRTKVRSGCRHPAPLRKIRRWRLRATLSPGYVLGPERCIEDLA